jgi:putative transposase
MPRIARTVSAGVPHHVTQRGNRREPVFFRDDDRVLYLDWLAAYGRRHGVDILAYCLMDNHVHLVGVPAREDSLERALRPLHMRDAQAVNRRHGWSGHLWQGRFFPSPLDEAHLWAAVRYVERNPVRAGIVSRAEDYPWSSAAGHCGLRHDPVVSASTAWEGVFAGVSDWSAWLSEPDQTAALRRLRHHARKNLPCGSEIFIERLEAIAGRPLRAKPPGRPRKE